MNTSMYPKFSSYFLGNRLTVRSANEVAKNPHTAMILVDMVGVNAGSWFTEM